MSGKAYGSILSSTFFIFHENYKQYAFCSASGSHITPRWTYTHTKKKKTYLKFRKNNIIKYTSSSAHSGQSFVSFRMDEGFTVGDVL